MKGLISSIFSLCGQTTESIDENDKQNQGDIKGHIETLLEIPLAVVNLVDVEKSVELARGKFSLDRLSDDEERSIALFCKVGDDLQWPVAMDVPIVKVDVRHYLFSVRAPPNVEENTESPKPGEDGPDVLNFGVTFAEVEEEKVEFLERRLKECACLSVPSKALWWSWCLPGSKDKKSDAKDSGEPEAYWTVLAPNVEEYNSMLGKAIAAGTGYVIKGIFMCSNGYSSQLRKGGQFVRSRTKAAENKPTEEEKKTSSEISPRVKANVKRIRKLSQMTETMSNTFVDGALIPLDTVGGFPAQNKCCRCCCRTFCPGGDMLLASLDSYNKIIEAVKVAAKDVGNATAQEIAETAAHRYGEVAHDTMAIAAHAIVVTTNVTRLTGVV